MAKRGRPRINIQKIMVGTSIDRPLFHKLEDMVSEGRIESISSFIRVAINKHYSTFKRDIIHSEFDNTIPSIGEEFED